MKHDIKEVTDGHLNGKIVWICDYRFTDFANKASRHVPPQRVLVRNNEETKKRVYYSESHFVGLNSKGQPVESKTISPFDTTGYRSSTGVPVNVFDSEMECKAYYAAQCSEALSGLDAWIDSQISRASAIKESIAKEIAMRGIARVRIKMGDTPVQAYEYALLKYIGDTEAGNEKN